jgi:predicted permease
MLRWIPELTRRLKYFLNKRHADAELREEMETHLAMLAEDTDIISAKQRLGNTTRWQEISREAWGWNWIESVVRDVGYGARLLLRSPGFTVTACLSLAIGLGATMGIFSLINALLFKPLPVPHAGQLWQLLHQAIEESDETFSYPMFAALKETNVGHLLFAISPSSAQVDYGVQTRRTAILAVSGDTFRLLDLQPYIGRLLTPDDDIRGLPHGANCVLSYRLWRSEFDGDPSALGRHLTIGRQSFTIVGVAPPTFFGFYVGAHADLILPMVAYAATNPAQPMLDAASSTWLNIMARAPSRAGARSLVANFNTFYPSIQKRLEPSSSGASKPEILYAVSGATGLSDLRNRFLAPLYVLLTMTGLILLIACANLANLLLARSVVRNREVAIRLSIGAHRGRILRQLLTESTLIGIIGACVGIPIYFICTHGLVAFIRAGSDPNTFLNLDPDWHFVVSVIALLFSTVLIFGFLPALRAIRSDLNTALSEGSRRLSAKTSIGKLVVGVQISLSLVLLLGAALLSQSLFDLRTFNPGFRRDHLLIAGVDTTQTLHKNAELVRFFDRLLDQVRALPGVNSASASVVVPLNGYSWQSDYEIVGHTDRSRHFHSFDNWISPEYFGTIGTSLTLGRNLDRRDSAQAPQVCLVNQTFAARAFGLSNPLGRQVRENGKHVPLRIVGVVADARYRELRKDAPPTLYRPISQLPPSFSFVLTLNLEVWTSTPASDLRAPIGRLLKRMDNHAVVDFHTFDALIDTNLLYERLLTALSVTFGLIGLFLSGIGVYGLAAYSVTRRIPEFGIRMALGASPGDILRLLFSEQIRLLALALAVGLIVSMATTRFLRAWLFGVSANDPVFYSFAVLLIALLALLAAFVPARRAARLNPSLALRCE